MAKKETKETTEATTKTRKPRTKKVKEEVVVAPVEEKPREMMVLKPIRKKEVEGEVTLKDRFLNILREMNVSFVEDKFSNEIMFRHPKTGIEAEKKENIVVFCFDYNGEFRYLG